MNPQAQGQVAVRGGGRGAAVASVLAVAAAMAGGVGAIGWWASASAGSGGPEAAAGRFVAFAFATMGLAWLAGPFAPAGRFDWPALFRWAVVIDAAGLGLLVGSLASEAVGWREGLALYAIAAAFAAMQLAGQWLLARAGAGPGAAAAVAAGVAAVACTTLLWGHLAGRPFRANSPGDSAVLAVVRYANPLLAADDAVNPPTRLDWSHHGLMYRRYGIIGEARTWPLPSWPIACAIYAAVAAGLAGAGAAVRKRRRAAG